jgi:molecular chaperone IbpA
MTKQITSTFTPFFDMKRLDPFSIGFDKMFEQLVLETSKTVPTYPPYNIKKVKDNKYVIEMAVAGFSQSDIEVTVEGNTLVVQGNVNDNDPKDGTMLYQGIANRAFKRTWTLADKVEIQNAEMVNGMLKIWLENLIKTQETIKKIKVN